jgi:hypothetical protein
MHSYWLLKYVARIKSQTTNNLQNILTTLDLQATQYGTWSLHNMALTLSSINKYQLLIFSLRPIPIQQLMFPHWLSWTLCEYFHHSYQY